MESMNYHQLCYFSTMVREGISKASASLRISSPAICAQLCSVRTTSARVVAALGTEPGAGGNGPHRPQLRGRNLRPGA